MSVYKFFASELLSSHELKMVNKIFKALDIEGDGELSSKEIMEAFIEYKVIENIPADSKDPKR
jgi:hypothetical protein